MSKGPSLEERAAAQIDFINGGQIEILGDKTERYFPPKEIYNYLLKHKYIKQIKGKTIEGRPKYGVTSNGEKFHEIKWKRPYKKNLKKWRDKMESKVEAIRESRMLTGKDLQTYINV